MTVASLVRFVLGTDGFVVSIIIVIMLVLATLAILGRTLHTRSWNSPGFIITLLLWSESIGRVIMANVFEVNYAEDRTASASYTHLTLPTNDLVEIAVVAGTLKQK